MLAMALHHVLAYMMYSLCRAFSHTMNVTHHYAVW